jgi:hypothetical protein
MVGELGLTPQATSKLTELPPADLKEADGTPVIESWFEYWKLPEGYERTWFRHEHPEMNKWGIDNGRWSSLEDRTIVSPKERDMLTQYDATDSKGRLAARCASRELDDLLVKTRGLTRAYGTSRCGRPTPARF